MGKKVNRPNERPVIYKTDAEGEERIHYNMSAVEEAIESLISDLEPHEGIIITDIQWDPTAGECILEAELNNKVWNNNDETKT